MAEYIDRKNLGIGYADPKVFTDPAYAEGWNSAITIINDAPIEDVVPVVRCKDCIYKGYPNEYGVCCCERNGEEIQLDDYCSRGVKCADVLSEGQ